MEIELGRVFRAVRRFWWAVIAMALVFVLIASLVWSLLPKSYTAESTMLVLPPSVSGATLTDDGAPIQTYIELIKSDSVLWPIVEEFEIDKNLNEFREAIVVSNVPGTSIILVEVSDPDPQRAADMANAITESFSIRAESLVTSTLQTKRDDLLYERDQINSQLAAIDSRIEPLTENDVELSPEQNADLESLQAERIHLQQRRADLNSNIRGIENTILNTQAPVTVSEVAVAPEVPGGLSAVLVGAAAGVLGALVGTGVMLWLELRDPYVRDEQHVGELTGTESITPISGSTEALSEQPRLRLAASRAAGLAGREALVFVSPRDSKRVREVADAMLQLPPLSDSNVVSAYGMLDTGVDTVLHNFTAMLFVERGQTRNQDVVDVVDVLRDLGVSNISVTMLSK